MKMMFRMEVRVALARIGNCASAPVQGVNCYRNATEGGTASGLMHVNFAGYRIRDVKFVAAFDVNRMKMGSH